MIDFGSMSRHTEVVLSSQVINGASVSEVVDMRDIDGPISFHFKASAKSSPASAAIQVQGSNDGVSYVNIGSATNIANNANNEEFMIEDDGPAYRYVRLSLSISSGSYTGYCIFSGVEAR